MLAIDKKKSKYVELLAKKKNLWKNFYQKKEKINLNPNKIITKEAYLLKYGDFSINFIKNLAKNLIAKIPE